jgi:hypothetical protein
VDGDKVTAAVLQPWRLFASVGPGGPDGSCTALTSNYNNEDLPVSVELPSIKSANDLLVSASWTYKGKTHLLAASIVPSRCPGVVTVRVIVPAHRAAMVTLRPKTDTVAR